MRPTLPSTRPSSRRRSRLTALVLAAALLALGSAAGVDAEELVSVEARPSLIVAGEPVELTLVVRSSCLVHLLGAEVTSSGFPRQVEVEVDLGCIIDPPLAADYTLTTQPLVLPPGDLIVRVRSGDLLLDGSAELDAHLPSSFVFEAPEAPFTDEEPVRLLATGPPLCGSLDLAVLPGNVIETRFVNDCVNVVAPDLFEAVIEPGVLPAGRYELRHFEERMGEPVRLLKTHFRVHDADGCVPTAAVPCLGDGRFEVRAAWFDGEAQPRDATAIPLADRDDTALFWFFDEDNVELTVRVLDGCAVNGHYWVFTAPGTTVEHSVLVTDPATTKFRRYDVPASPAPALTADTAAFACD